MAPTPYRVRVEIAGSGLRGRCNCPYGAEGVFLQALRRRRWRGWKMAEEVGEPRPEPVSDERLRAFLLSWDQAWLADQLLLRA